MTLDELTQLARETASAIFRDLDIDASDGGGQHKTTTATVLDAILLAHVALDETVLAPDASGPPVRDKRSHRYTPGGKAGCWHEWASTEALDRCVLCGATWRLG